MKLISTRSSKKHIFKISGQYGGIGRLTSPHTTIRRITANIKTKKHLELPEN